MRLQEHTESIILVKRSGRCEQYASRSSYIDGDGEDCIADLDSYVFRERMRRIALLSQKMKGLGITGDACVMKGGVECVNTAELSYFIGVTVRDVRRFRDEEGMPFAIKDRSGQFWYNLNDVDEWMLNTERY